MTAPTCNQFLRECREAFGSARVVYAANGNDVLTGQPPVRDTTDYEAEHIAAMSPVWRAAHDEYSYRLTITA